MLGMHRRGFRTIPYTMFDREFYGLEAKNARVLERIYHKGHAQAWDGQKVLASLIETHGSPTLSEDKKKALGRVFSIIMWGELAAWRISAELADELEPLEAKLAATSQAHDEARHFYVFHDYLEHLDAWPDRIDMGARKLLEAVMNADHLAKKLLGMQLMVEPIALTLFHVVKKLDVEPVLTHLLPYYERDESRHVALGLQYLPAMLSRMSVAERVALWAFQFKLMTYELWSNVGLSRDLMTLGVDPRMLIEVGKGKQMKALSLTMQSLGVEVTAHQVLFSRYADVMAELTLPAMGQDGSVLKRLERAWGAVLHGSFDAESELVPEVSDEQVPLIKRAAEAVEH